MQMMRICCHLECDKQYISMLKWECRPVVHLEILNLQLNNVQIAPISTSCPHTPNRSTAHNIFIEPSSTSFCKEQPSSHFSITFSTSFPSVSCSKTLDKPEETEGKKSCFTLFWPYIWKTKFCFRWEEAMITANHDFAYILSILQCHEQNNCP
jgi:hypothetical protein